MDNYEKERRIKKVREALENGKVLSVEFYKDGSGASFHYIYPEGDHGLPCDIAASFPIEEALQIISGFRFKQHEYIKCF